ncbi:hypothetical protein SPI_00170 [Niveomyces insectorum RCEF 264]|uniref:Transcription factor domain-containing protein n=1 Tax=Niveomyces insectorum RCEF 264 TaxID=1081102 RepID=A0A167ZWD3_9HYPO|nr:hypothetical protein SPI_00170 [Niveomyces insectorum RCEF 264]
MRTWAAAGEEEASPSQDQLVEKLDSIVSLLSDRRTVASRSEDQDAATSPTASPDTSVQTNAAAAAATATAVAAAGPRLDADLPRALLPPAPLHAAAVSGLPWGASADWQLQFFQTDMASYFPFVVVPAGTTAAGLRATKPSLHDSIMMALSYQNVARQAELRDAYIRSCTSQIFLQGKKSLDLLQSILVFAAWYHHHLLPSPQLTNMVQLATALLFDLGLHRTQNASDRHDISVGGWKSVGTSSRTKPPRTLEERRAFLGLFCLTRGLAANIGKIEPLQNTRYVAECCAELERCQEHASDTFLVFQVRCQNVADVAARSFPHDGADYWSELGTDTIHMLVQSFQDDVDTFRLSLDAQLIQSPLVRLHCAILSVHNTEIALRGEPPPAQTTPHKANPVRLKLLMTCLLSTKAFFADWLALPSGLYYRLPMTVFALVAHAVVVLGMLNCFRCAGWDLDAVRQIAPLLPVLDSLAQKYDEASRETDDSSMSGCNPFCREGSKMKRLKEWYEARLPTTTTTTTTNTTATTATTMATGQENEGVALSSSSSFDLAFDELYWTETMDWFSFNPGASFGDDILDAREL